MGSRLPYRGLQNCASLLAGGTGTVIGIGTPVGRDVEVDRAVAVRLGSGGGGVVAVGIVLSVAVGEETGVGVAVGREVEAGTGAGPPLATGSVTLSPSQPPSAAVRELGADPAQWAGQMSPWGRPPEWW